MKLAGQKFSYQDVFHSAVTVADSWVKSTNKIGTAHGEAKLYFANKARMRDFFGQSGFSARCIMLKADLLSYMLSVKSEYFKPVLDYRTKVNRENLWTERMAKVEELSELMHFNIQEQTQIEGIRGYINSTDSFYDFIRELALPFISFFSVMHLKDGTHDLFYWKLFADFVEMDKRLSALENYGKAKGEQENQIAKQGASSAVTEYKKAREGQGKYRERLLEECPFCPITMIGEEALLIASHIKPWAMSDDKEKVDPKNGLILSPLYDRLFDKGFITFNDDKTVEISNWLSRQDAKRIGIIQHQLFKFLPIDDCRRQYLEFHRQRIYKG